MGVEQRILENPGRPGKADVEARRRCEKLTGSQRAFLFAKYGAHMVKELMIVLHVTDSASFPSPAKYGRLIECKHGVSS